MEPVELPPLPPLLEPEPELSAPLLPPPEAEPVELEPDDAAPAELEPPEAPELTPSPPTPRPVLRAVRTQRPPEQTAAAEQSASTTQLELSETWVQAEASRRPSAAPNATRLEAGQRVGFAMGGLVLPVPPAVPPIAFEKPPPTSATFLRARLRVGRGRGERRAMRAAGTVERFVQAPIGAWVAGRCVLMWSWSPSLCGSVVWGRPGEADVEQFFVLSDAYRLSSPGCDVVTDVSRVDSVESTLYAAFVRGMQSRATQFATGVRRHALVRPEGLVGGLAEGFFPITGVQHDWRVFGQASEAFAWLERPGAELANLEVVRLVDEARGLSPELRSLRDYLRTHLRDARLAAAAVALGTSERTLHRALRDAKTCFRDELGAARVDAARRLLAETDLKIQEIARRVGYASHANLTSLFTRSTGQSPAAYREQATAATSGR